MDCSQINYADNMTKELQKLTNDMKESITEYNMKNFLHHYYVSDSDIHFPKFTAHKQN